MGNRKIYILVLLYYWVMAKGIDVKDGALCEALGEDSAEIIRVIDAPMEDKDISRELDFETSRVRSCLNELLVKNLVQLNRKRLDTGYCHYRWVRREDKIREYVDTYVSKRIKKLNGMLPDSEDIVFECGCSRIDYGRAIDQGFSCPDCGKTLKQISSGKGSRKIKSELKRLESLRNAS
ncbi:MAG: hypothetical protein GF416_03920 [Candidatus Altiarchaeales archaeon]|nr:hypothetical protein [Candidatus Altiarchaeales archaeon]MBD3416266.1 hypothetical protein [Candidatus Altiarchaeales archaeon]